jgi:hypothetical protein
MLVESGTSRIRDQLRDQLLNECFPQLTFIGIISLLTSNELFETVKGSRTTSEADTKSNLAIMLKKMPNKSLNAYVVVEENAPGSIETYLNEMG